MLFSAIRTTNNNRLSVRPYRVSRPNRMPGGTYRRQP